MTDESQLEELTEIDGAILSVHLRNFFCHDNLDVKFNKNVNFIVGRNGSGKSAILTALVVGLGGRAAATNRGSNLHSFIKKGTNSATVEIKIKNSSPRSYKPELYGHSITVVRTLNLSGGSAYKIKNHEGAVVSTKAADVQSITTALDIQVDNPICILNQDEARNFHAADAKRKYLLYRKATNLDQTEANYNKTASNCEKAAAVWEMKHDAFKELEKELRQWEIRYEQIQSREEIKQKEMKLQDEYYWSEIAELEEELNKLTAFEEKQTNKVQRLISKGDSLKNDSEDIKNKLNELHARTDQLNTESSDIDKDFESVTKRLQKARDNMKELRSEHNKKLAALQLEENKVKDFQREISAASEDNRAAERTQLEKTIGTFEIQMEEANARKATVSLELNQTRSAIAHHQTDEEESSANRDAASGRARHCAALLRELDVRGQEGLAVFGRRMEQLVGAVKAAHRRGQFGQEPRGPIGSYLKVRDKKWAGAVEHIIGGSMSAFAVNAKADLDVLVRIMGQVYGDEAKPSVTTSKFFFQVHDTSRNAVVPPRGFFSALDCLQVADPVVTNFLIDAVRLEGILMVPTDDDAIQLCRNIDSVPRNCKKIVTLDGSEFFPPPNYRSYGGAGKPSRFLQVNTTDRKKQIDSELSNAKRDLDRAEVEMQKIKREKAALVDRENSLKEQLHKLMKVAQHLQTKILDSKDRLKDYEGGYVNVLVEELQSSEANLANMKSEMEKIKSRENESKDALRNLESKAKAVRGRMQENRDSSMTSKEESSRLQMKLDRAKADAQNGVRLQKEEEDKLKLVAKQVKEQGESIRVKMRSARELSARIPNPRKKEAVIEDLKKIEAKIKSIAKDGPSKREVAAKLVELQKKHSDTKKVLQSLSSLIEEIKRTSDEHLQYCQSVQTLVARRVQYCFQSILTLRGFSGSMRIDQGRGLLEIKCSGRDAAGKRLADSTSSLSGGERSYSTVAFIMALWDCVEMPFYFMDEFDVFMDNVNRKIVMELLVAHALKNHNRQFVFLTPQDASSVSAGPNIKIHRMADPERKSIQRA